MFWGHLGILYEMRAHFVRKKVCDYVFTVYKWYCSIWWGQQQMHQIDVKKIFRGVL